MFRLSPPSLQLFGWQQTLNLKGEKGHGKENIYDFKHFMRALRDGYKK
jgi:hypothetical protein